MSGDFDLRLLQSLSADESRSGEALAGELGCSRTAVWKHIEAVRALGIGVEAVAGLGYRLDEPIELLDQQAIIENLASPTRQALTSLKVLKSVESTNAVLQSLPIRTQHASAIMAERQSAGRGRRGRGWFSPFARNLYLSLGWRFETGAGDLGCLPLVVALAAVDALESAGISGTGIKWPNDLVLDGAKLGGCLVELQGDASGPCNAVMGVGINVRMPASTRGAQAIDQSWTDLERHRPGVSRNALAANLLNSLVEGIQRYARAGFAAFAQRWDSLDVLAGREIVLTLGQESVQGTANGISHRGGLRVLSAAGEREYHSGEVSVRPAG